MTGADFLDALRFRIAPVAIVNQTGDHKGVKLTLSNGRVIEVQRAKVRDLGGEDEIGAYMDKLLA